ncbi:hypothetical protein DMH01_15815 [Amycolatopsis sp. WAC 04182]|nr:hypothetical protein DMH01_15815 [Amycolatopsis sp. WAC 04182]
MTETVAVNSLTTEDKPHPHSGQPRRTTYLHLRAPATVPDDWSHHVCGDGYDTLAAFPWCGGSRLSGSSHAVHHAVAAGRRALPMVGMPGDRTEFDRSSRRRGSHPHQ